MVQARVCQGGQLHLQQSVYGGNKLNLQFGTPPGGKATVPEAAAAKQHTAKNSTRATGLEAMHQWDPDPRTTSWDGAAAVRKELESRLAGGEGLEMSKITPSMHVNEQSLGILGSFRGLFGGVFGM